MTTAQEIELKALMALPRLAAITRHVEAMTRDLVTYGAHVAIGREVCARRARKLRKRGESVRYIGRTTTGKTRYSWLRTIPPWEIYMPNAEVRGDAPLYGAASLSTDGFGGADNGERK